MTPFSTISLLSPLSSKPLHRTCIMKGGSSWGLCGEDTPAHHIMSREAPGALSKECSFQWELQGRSPWESTAPLNSCAVHGHHMTPHCRHTWLTAQLNNLYLKSQIPAWKPRCFTANIRQTHDVMGCKTGPRETKRLRLDRDTVFTGTADYIFPTLSKIICIFIYTKQMVIYLAEETLCEWFTIKPSPHHLFFNPINYIQVCK